MPWNAQQQYNLAEKSAYHSFVSIHGPIKGGQKGFRRLLKERGWKVPHHYTTRHKPPEVQEAERRFVEEGLDRSGAYYSPRYPLAPEPEPEEE